MLKEWFIPSTHQQRQISVVVFGLVGVLLLAYAVSLATSVAIYVTSASRATATVDSRISREGWPVLRYHNGTREILFAQPPVLFVGTGLKEGDSVEILYDPEDPSATRIDSFASNWLSPLQALVAGAFLLALAFRRWRLAYLPVLLSKHGREVEASVAAVSTRISLWDKGRIWQVHAEWTDPDTNRLHHFTSIPLKRDPTPHLQPGQPVVVRFNPKRVSLYVVEVEPLLSKDVKPSTDEGGATPVQVSDK